MAFTLAIIGRPNVGKSTLFNRLVGKQMALVHNTPGLTRDWREEEAELLDLKFRIIDTAGLEEEFNDSIRSRMRQQTERALEHADMAILMIDARTGITPMDRHFADWIRRQKIPSALVANKCESKVGVSGMYEAYELGMGEPLAISAEHNLGIRDLYDLLKPYIEKAKNDEDADLEFDNKNESEYIKKAFETYQEGTEKGFGDEETPKEEETAPIKIAIVGRPNVGKSTLLNSLVKEERSMTGPEAGITRDSVHVSWDFEGRYIKLVDTAGLRKKSRITDKIEKMSADDSFRAIRLAQVVVLVIDAELTVQKQDLLIAQHVIEEGRALVIAVNKWDKIKNRPETLDEIQYQLEKSLPQVKNLLAVTISALNGSKLDRLMKAILETYSFWNKRVPTGPLNRWLKTMESHHPAPLVNGRQNRLRYITQIKARPPTFGLWVARADNYPESHKRYLVNNLRRDFEVPSTPIRFIIKKSKNPYA